MSSTVAVAESIASSVLSLRPRLSQSIADATFAFFAGHFADVEKAICDCATFSASNKSARRVKPKIDADALASLGVAYADGYAMFIDKTMQSNGLEPPKALLALPFGAAVWHTEELPGPAYFKPEALTHAVFSEMLRTASAGDDWTEASEEWRVRVLARLFAAGAEGARAAAGAGELFYPVPPLVPLSRVPEIAGSALALVPDASDYMLATIARKVQLFNASMVSKKTGATPLTHDRETAANCLRVYAMGFISGLLGSFSDVGGDDDELLYAMLENWRDRSESELPMSVMDSALAFACSSAPDGGPGGGRKYLEQTSYARMICGCSYLDGAVEASMLRVLGCREPLSFSPSDVIVERIGSRGGDGAMGVAEELGDEVPGFIAPGGLDAFGNAAPDDGAGRRRREPNPAARIKPVETKIGEFRVLGADGIPTPRSLVGASIFYSPAENAFAVFDPERDQGPSPFGWGRFAQFVKLRAVTFTDPEVERNMRMLLERARAARRERIPDAPSEPVAAASLLSWRITDDTVLIGSFKPLPPAPEEYWGSDVFYSPSQEPPFAVIGDGEVLGTIAAEAFPKMAALGVIEFAAAYEDGVKVTSGADDGDVQEEPDVPVMGSVSELKRLLGIDPQEAVEQTVSELEGESAALAEFLDRAARRRSQQRELAALVYEKACSAADARLAQIEDVADVYDEVPYAIVFPRALTADATGFVNVYADLLEADGMWVKRYLKDRRGLLPPTLSLESVDYKRLDARITETIGEILDGDGLYTQQATRGLEDVRRYREERDVLDAFKPTRKRRFLDDLASYSKNRVRAADVLYRNTKSLEDLYTWYPQFFLAPAIAEANAGNADPICLLVDNFDDEDLAGDIESAKKYLRFGFDVEDVDIGRIRAGMSAYLESETGYKTLEMYRSVALILARTSSDDR